jgi:predicted O-methyltransferase YrrM
VDVALVEKLYRTHREDLLAVIAQQREFREALAGRMTPQLDDLEAELTYLLLRHHRPAVVMELGTFHGWSTTWLLSALRDNGAGELHSFDRIDNVARNVPRELADRRWTFVHGDVREQLAAVPPDTDYLFVDADHGARFGHWYLEHLFPLMPAGIPVNVHDVLRGRRARPWSEGAVLTRWLDDRGVEVFSTSRKGAPETFAQLNDLRAELGITGARETTRNPMIFFRLP